MNAGEAWRQLFKSIGDFARSTRDADREREGAEIELTPAGKVWPDPPGAPPKDWAVGDRVKPATPSAGARPTVDHGSTGTFAGIKGDAEIEAIVTKRLKQFGLLAGLEWDDRYGVDANLTTWFLNQSEGR